MREDLAQDSKRSCSVLGLGQGHLLTSNSATGLLAYRSKKDEANKSVTPDLLDWDCMSVLYNHVEKRRQRHLGYVRFRVSIVVQ